MTVSTLLVRVDAPLLAMLEACAAQSGRTVEAECAIAAEFYVLTRTLSDLQRPEVRADLGPERWRAMRDDALRHIAQVAAVATGDPSVIASLETRLRRADDAQLN